MDFRFGLAIALALLAPACTAVIAPDTNRLGGVDSGGRDGAIGELDAQRPDGAVPDAELPDGDVPDVGLPDAAMPMCPPSCEDTVPCTTDSCDVATGTCRHTPVDGACGDGMRCAGPAGCVPILCTSSAECDDGDVCNGAETCDPGGAGASPTTGCVPGDALDCRDEADCTEDRCDPSSGCVHVTNDGACNDGAACTSDTCSLSGCVFAPNDGLCNGGCTMGAVCVSGTGCTGGTSMSCGGDGNPCTSDPVTCDTASGTCLHPQRDDDGDGFLIARATGSAGTVSCGGDDCNDMNGAVHPGATEICNGIDDDCEGGIDEGLVCMSLPDTCATEQRITLVGGGAGGTSTGSASGSNRSLDDDYRASCGGTGGRDAVYLVELPAGLPTAVNVTISTDHAGTSFDTVVAAQVGGTCGSFGRACNDDIGGGNARSTATFCVTPSATFPLRVHILVDGYDGGAGSVGDYTLSVTVTPRAGVTCP